jgi:putative NIF3 family GTP cyclohydrolase 1 type 2
VTGDIGYHAFLDYGSTLLLADATHRATELPILDIIRNRLAAQFGALTFVLEHGVSPDIKVSS